MEVNNLNAIVDKVDGIVCCPLNAAQFKDAYDKVLAAKIPLVDVAIDSKHTAAISYVGTDVVVWG